MREPPLPRLYRRSPQPRDNFGCGFLIIWGLGALVVLAFWVVVIWAIVRIVLHYT